MSGKEELPILIPSEDTPMDRRSHPIGFIPRPGGQVVEEVFLNSDYRAPRPKPVEQMTSDPLPRNKVRAAQNRKEPAPNMLLLIQNAFEAEERVNPTGENLWDLRRVVISITTVVYHQMMLSQPGSGQVLSSDVEVLNRRVQHVELELIERRTKERHLMEQIQQLQAEKQELEKTVERDMAAMEESMIEYGPEYWETYTNHMVESAVNKVAGRINQNGAPSVLRGPSVTRFTPRSTFADDAMGQWRRKKHSLVNPFQPAIPVRRYAASSHVAEPETPPPIMERPQRDNVGEVENLKLVIRGQDKVISKLQKQLNMPGRGISRQGSTAFPTTIRKRNQPDEFSSSPVLRILSTPRSPLLKALRSAKSMHNETEIIHLIRLAEDKITQLTESAKQCTTQEKTQRKGVQAIQKALDEGIQRKEKLEDEMGKTADFFAHGGPSAEMQSLHNRIRKIAERLGAQNEQNNRLEQEKDVRGQWLTSATTLAAQMNNVIISLNQLLGWLKTRKQQGVWLNAELEDAEESEAVFTPLSERRLLGSPSWPSKTVPDSAKTTLAGIEDVPGTGGGRMSARSSYVGPVQDAPAVEMSPLEPDVPGMNPFWRIVVDQFLAWKIMYAFGRDLGWETLRYLNAIDKAEDIQMEPFNPPPFPWEGMLTVAYHLQLAATLEVYVASQRQRDIWMSANGLTRDYMIQSHREPPAWMFIPGVDEDLILRGRDVRRLIVWVIGLLHPAISSIWDFLLWAVEASTVWIWQHLWSRR